MTSEEDNDLSNYNEVYEPNTTLSITAAPTPIFSKYKKHKRKIIIPHLHMAVNPELEILPVSVENKEHSSFTNSQIVTNNNKNSTLPSLQISVRKSFNKIIQKRRPPGQVYPFNCDLCGLGFMVKESVTAHKRRKHGSCKYVCELCNNSFSMQKELACHYVKHRSHDGFQCPDCPKIFELIASFLRHRKTHISPKKFVCTVCDNKFRTNGELKSHSALHSSVRRYTCEVCSQGFNAQKLLADHMNSHTGDRPYVCDCGKNFKTTSALTNHKKIHLDPDLRPYKCDFCDMKFITNSVRRKHMRTHTGEKTYKCSECDVVLSCASSLLKHRRGHTNDEPYECNQCQMRFNTYQKLRFHKYIHAGIKPFKCKLCNASFSQSSLLERHKQVHGKSYDKKVFRCDSCNFNFGIEGKFIEHMKMHDKVKNTKSKIKVHNFKVHIVPKDISEHFIRSTRQKAMVTYDEIYSDTSEIDSLDEIEPTVYVDVKEEPHSDGETDREPMLDPLSSIKTEFL